MEHWSGIYLRQNLELPALLGASGVAVFHATMAAGRLGTAWTVALFGNRRTLLGAGLLAAVGMSLALATLEPIFVVAGFLVVGLALSAVVPVAFSVAGDLAPGRAGGAISVVTTLGYGGFLLGPVLVGGLAEILGLRVALGTIAAAGALIFTLSLRLAASDQSSTPGEDMS
jgi:MFS family permease